MATTRLRGRTAEVEIDPAQPTRCIGERCNALGYRVVREAVEADDYEVVAERARAQVAAGAAIVNVNMVGTNVEETLALPRAVERVAEAVDVPLSIDFGSHEALREALRIVPGRALINSTNGESRKLDPTLEIAREFGAALIAMLSNDTGIPATARERVETAEAIVRRAADFDLGVEDLLFDPICVGVATDPQAGAATFETCRLVREEFGANLALGASNASFGLPRRRTLDAAYLAMAIAYGVNVPITDPTLPSLRWAVLSADCCLGRDAYGMRFIQAHRAEEARDQ